MTFTTPLFLIGLLPWFLLAAYLSRRIPNARVVLISAANIVFLICGGVSSLLVASYEIAAVWAACKITGKRRSRCILFGGYAFLLAPLFLVKAGPLFHGGNVIMPLGISFYTFQAVSCLADVYAGKITERIRITDLFLYLSFFPTITSGPIVRFQQFEQGLAEDLSFCDIVPATERITLGLAKKVLIADKIAVLADYYFNGIASGNSFSALGLWMGACAYSLQLYFDFSGYSDIAIGIGRLLGFRIPENFQYPYHASSIKDFWRRWHISLSQWFRDYVYIPLGGSRAGQFRTIGNMLIVWLLTGIWHGNDATFLIWGIGYFSLLLLERYVPFFREMGEKWYGHIYTMFFVIVLWVPFRADNMNVMRSYFSGMFGLNGWLIPLEDFGAGYFPLFTISALLCRPWEKALGKFRNETWFLVLREITYAVVFAFAISAVVGFTYSPYIYGKF